MKYTFDCAVIGAGIAGMTAAIYLKRANLNVVIIDKDAPGGLLNKVASIENYPGFSKISGPDLAFKAYTQIQELGIEYKYGNVLKISDHIITTDLEEITANKIIIATGRTPKKITDQEKYENLSYCALCDANLYKNKVVAVVGGGNSALEESLYLADICKQIIIINRSDNLKADEIIQNKIKGQSNIILELNSSITKINAKDNIIYQIETTTGNFDIDALFSYIGYEPSTSFLENIKMENNYIIVNDKMQTNINYIYACGDIIKKDVYQISTAVGEGATAAISVKKCLDKEKD